MQANLRHFSDGRVHDMRYHFGRGDSVRVISGTYYGYTATVNSVVCQKSYDYPDEVAPGYHVTLEDGKWVTLRWDQVA